MKTAARRDFERPVVGRRYSTSVNRPRGEVIRRHQPSRVPAKRSPFAGDIARLRGDLRSATADGRRIAHAHRRASASVARIRGEFLRAHDEGKLLEADAFLVEWYESEHELRQAERGLAAIRSRFDRIEGELLNLERFA
jgi:hypothetical protein